MFGCGNTYVFPPSSGVWTAGHSSTVLSDISLGASSSTESVETFGEKYLKEATELAHDRSASLDLHKVITALLPESMTAYLFVFDIFGILSRFKS